MKFKPALYSLEMKLLKFEYTPLNKGLWYTCFETTAGSGN